MVSLERKSPVFGKLSEKLSFGTINAWEKSATYRKIATMIRAGVSIVRALQVVSETDNVALKKILAAIARDVESGSGMSIACAKHPALFNSVDASIIASGESTGTLDKVLMRLADEKQKEANLRQKLQSAMVYPVIVVLVIIGVIAVMVKNVVPVLEEIFNESNVELPLATRVLMGFSHFMTNYWWLIISLLIIFTICFVFYVRTTMVGKYLWSLVKLRFPIFGSIHQDIALAESSNCLSLLISSGVPIIAAVKLASGVTANEIYRSAFQNVALELEKGIPVSASMEVFSKIFPNILFNMVSVGEESGNLDQMLTVLSQYYESEADTKIKNLSSSLEPILIVILGLGVGYVVFAIMLPIYSLSSVY
jgi:type II secretory pathway component PulF